MQVTSRELKLRLGRYLDAVRHGETVRVTHRGSPIAEIRPLMPSTHDRLAQLIAQGRATPGGGRLAEHTPTPSQRSASAIVLADRAAEDDPTVLDDALGRVGEIRLGDRLLPTS